MTTTDTSKNGSKNGHKAAGNGAAASAGLEHRQILSALRAFKRGDFTVKMREDLVGVDGQIAETFNELVELAMAVYWIDITARRALSVPDLAKVFAAFRWGGLLKLHDISAMEFPYSVAGLTEQRTKMRWPDIKDRNAPDKPGTRFRMPFGAVPIALCLGYPAIA